MIAVLCVVVVGEAQEAIWRAWILSHDGTNLAGIAQTAVFLIAKGQIALFGVLLGLQDCPESWLEVRSNKRDLDFDRQWLFDNEVLVCFVPCLF